MSITENLKTIKAIEDSLNLMEDGSGNRFYTAKEKIAIDMYKNLIPYFKDKDIIEFEHTLIPPEKLQLMWNNLHIFSYDIDNFFLNEGVMHLMVNGELKYKVYFNIEDIYITVITTYKNTDDLVGCGAIIVKDGKFEPSGCIVDKYLPLFEATHKMNGLPTNKDFIADRLILDAFSNLVILNQYVTNHKDVVIETSKRVPITTNKKRKKHSPKKTKIVRTIKIDPEKAKKIYQKDSEDKREYERHTEQWTRRGHYRKLKNGTMKWIKPQTVKAKTKCKDTVVAKRIYQVQ